MLNKENTEKIEFHVINKSIYPKSNNYNKYFFSRNIYSKMILIFICSFFLYYIQFNCKNINFNIFDNYVTEYSSNNYNSENNQSKYLNSNNSIGENNNLSNFSLVLSNNSKYNIDYEDKFYNNFEDEILLIYATGRSGSTTLQRIINIIPNSNICGENRGAMNYLLEFYNSLKIASTEIIPGRLNPYKYDYLIKKRIKPAWYNIYNITDIEIDIKKLIVKMFKNSINTKLWGFKEIRFFEKTNLILLFKELFPQTKIITHIRKDIDKQSVSSWFKNNPEASKAQLVLENEELNSFYEKNKDYVYFSTFENLFNISEIEKIFDFLGYLDIFDKKKYNEIIMNSFEHKRKRKRKKRHK